MLLSKQSSAPCDCLDGLDVRCQMLPAGVMHQTQAIAAAEHVYRYQRGCQKQCPCKQQQQQQQQ